MYKLCYVRDGPYAQRALAIDEQVYGPEHPEVATSLNNLASLYQDQGKYEEAERLLERALLIRQQTLEPEHPDTAQSEWWLATLAGQQGKYSEAKRLYEQALQVFRQQLGGEHPHTQAMQSNYDAFLEEMGHE